MPSMPSSFIIPRVLSFIVQNLTHQLSQEDLGLSGNVVPKKSLFGPFDHRLPSENARVKFTKPTKPQQLCRSPLNRTHFAPGARQVVGISELQLITQLPEFTVAPQAHSESGKFVNTLALDVINRYQ